jgi:uncharacterized protein
VPGSIVIAAAAAAEFAPAPITRDWILNGEPAARRSELAKSRDRTSYVMAWDCTAGRFHWHYAQDETVVITGGEVFITGDDGVERRLAAGDAAFFPAGSSATWRVTEHVRKVAVVREAIPHPLAVFVRAWRKSKQLTLRMQRTSLSWGKPWLTRERGDLWPAIEP